MLDNHPRHQLRFIIDNYGRSIIDDPRRCRGMLKDLAPKHQLETNLLMLALDQKLVAELTQKTHTPILMHLDILAQRLHNNIGIQKEFAVWAIESWALALDVIQQPSAQQTITPEPEPIPTIVKPESKIIIPPKPAPIVSKPTPILSTSQQKIGKFIVQDGVATDTETDLMWLRFAYGQMEEKKKITSDNFKWLNLFSMKTEKVSAVLNWHDAMKIPEEFNQQGYVGYNDWRVPSIHELKTLVDKSKSKSGNYIDTDVFPENKGGFWSSSPYNNDSAWVIYFGSGNFHSNVKGSSHHVRLVRK